MAKYLILFICCIYLIPNTFSQTNDLDTNVLYQHYFLSEARELVSLDDFEGQTLIVDFWFTGCSGCSHFFKEKLTPVVQELRGNVTLISVSTDKDFDQWQTSIETGNYTDERSINLYTGGRGFGHRFLAAHKISTYPSLIIRSANGVSTIIRGANSYSREEIAEIIQKYL